MRKVHLVTFLFTLFISISNLSAQVDNGLILHYSFDSSNASDLVGSNHGTVNGATSCPDRFGNPNMAYSFSTNDIQASNCNLGNLTEASISLWLKPDSATFNAGITCIANISNWAVYMNRFSTDGRLIGVMDGSSVNNNSSHQSSQISMTDWTHLVVTNDGSTTSIYINGTLDNSFPETFSWVNGNSIYLAAQPISGSLIRHYNGKMDDFRIYEKALNLQEVDSLFNMPDPIMSISEAHAVNEVNIYPNPSNGFFNIKTEGFNINLIKIADLSGKVILTKDIEQQSTINLSSLPNGIYSVKLFNNKGYIGTKKIIKIE